MKAKKIITISLPIVLATTAVAGASVALVSCGSSVTNVTITRQQGVALAGKIDAVIGAEANNTEKALNAAITNLINNANSKYVTSTVVTLVAQPDAVSKPNFCLVQSVAITFNKDVVNVSLGTNTDAPEHFTISNNVLTYTPASPVTSKIPGTAVPMLTAFASSLSDLNSKFSTQDAATDDMSSPGNSTETTGTGLVINVASDDNSKGCFKMSLPKTDPTTVFSTIDGITLNSADTIAWTTTSNKFTISTNGDSLSNTTANAVTNITTVELVATISSSEGTVKAKANVIVNFFVPTNLGQTEANSLVSTLNGISTIKNSSGLINHVDAQTAYNLATSKEAIAEALGNGYTATNIGNITVETGKITIAITTRTLGTVSGSTASLTPSTLDGITIAKDNQNITLTASGMFS